MNVLVLSESVPSRDNSEISVPRQQRLSLFIWQQWELHLPMLQATGGQCCSGGQGVLSVTGEELVLLFGIKKYGTETILAHESC